MSEGITEVYKKGRERNLHLWVNSIVDERRGSWRGRGTNLKNSSSDGGEMKVWTKDGRQDGGRFECLCGCQRDDKNTEGAKYSNAFCVTV